VERKHAQREESAKAPGPGAKSAHSLQSTVGNRAFTGLVQRTFSHKGKKKEPTTYKAKDPLPTIHGVSEAELRKLAEDEHPYGAIENKAAFALAWAVYQQRHAKQAEVVPLEAEQGGNVTLRDLEEVEQTAFAGTVRVTLQLDWLQGKHDGPFMAKSSTETPRKQGDNQMRQSLSQYQALADGVPLELATARLAEIFAKAERVPFDFSVMDTKQSDGLYYEISAKWASLGAGARHVLVYYHCFPDAKDQKRFGFK
jgi:hypothetical protein